MRNNARLFVGIFLTALLCGFVSYFHAGAFNGPSQTPPSGSGSLGSNGTNNLSVGTSTPSQVASLLVVASTTGGTTNYALEVLDSSQNMLFSVRNDGAVFVGTSTLSGGIYTGTIAAGNVYAGQFGSNTSGGSYGFPGALTATSGTVSLASTTIAGNATTTSLTVTGATILQSSLSQSGGTVSLASTTITGSLSATSFTLTGVTNALHLGGSAGAVTGYGGSNCSAGNAVTGISASGTATCSAFSTSAGSGTVTTSTAVTANNFAFWNATNGAGLNGTSTLSISGTTVTQLNNFQIGGTLNVTSSVTFAVDATLVGSSTFKNNVNVSGSAGSISSCGTGSGSGVTGTNFAGVITAGSTGSPTVCTISFASPNFKNAPVCVVSPVSASSTYVVTSTVSAMTISKITPAIGANGKFNYICIGQ